MIGLAKVAPLMYLAGKRLDELTMADFGRVATVFGIAIDVTEELKQAGLALLKGQNIHTVADMIQSPESVSQLMNFLRGRGINGDIAAAEVDDMYSTSSQLYSVETDVVEPDHVQSLHNPRQSGLITSASVGWRLPG